MPYQVDLLLGWYCKRPKTRLCRHPDSLKPGNMTKRSTPENPPKRPDPAIAERAKAEAAARRAEIDRVTSQAIGEKGGRGGLDPIRYGDWEIKGLTSDF